VGSAWVAHRRVTLTGSPWHMPSRTTSPRRSLASDHDRLHTLASRVGSAWRVRHHWFPRRLDARRVAYLPPAAITACRTASRRCHRSWRALLHFSAWWFLWLLSPIQHRPD